jgi:predicted nucleic acid-binding protein
MNIILDTNILFAAIIKDSVVRKIILDYEGCFITQIEMLNEFENHKAYLIKKSGLSQYDFNILLNALLEKLIVVPKSIYSLYLKKAYAIIKDIDVNDVAFIACALHYDKCIFWSNDLKLKEQKTITVYTTEEMIQYLEKQS